MEVWFALLIPVLTGAFFLIRHRNRVHFLEMLLLTFVCSVVIFFTDYFIVKAYETDTEFRGSVIVRARYYESWETYVYQTCTRTVSCGKDCTTTETYDCSYCDSHPAKWVAIDNLGNEFPISKKKYEEYEAAWGHPKFVDMNRNITKTLFCGKDGDMWEVNWKGDFDKTDAAVIETTYENKTQSAKSAFNFEKITEEEAQKLGLYDYPPITDTYIQRCILGLDKLIPDAKERRGIEKKWEIFNGLYGPQKKVKLFVLLFHDKPFSIARKQQSYWAGGNQNEVVVCIGLKGDKLTWVKAFSWCEDKYVENKIRENLMNLERFEMHNVYPAIARPIGDKFKVRDLKNDFDYLRVDLPAWAIILIYILTILLTVAGCLWAYTNDFGNEDY